MGTAGTRARRRLAALGAATLWLAVATPGPAAATAGPSWEPPPVNLAALPPDRPPGPPPGVTYTQRTRCVSSTTDATTPLPDVPAAQAMLDISGAHRFATGAGVKVAVIDTGVNPNPFLTDHGRLRGGGDYVAPGPASDGTVDCDGHGTLTAGIVAANTEGSGFGFTGVAPGAIVYAIRQTSTVYSERVNGHDTGETAGTPSTLASAIVHAVHLGVSVITTSVDVCLPTAEAVREMHRPDSPEQRLQAAVAYAVDHNVVVVNSAGNVPSGSDGDPCSAVRQNDDPDPNHVGEIEVPAVFSDDLLSVASVNPTTGAVSPFSVWGPWVNIAAPGEGIVSVNPAVGGSGLARTYAEPGRNGPPGPIQGTSFAAPYVAGVVALVRARFPNLKARQVIRRIEATAQHPSGPGGRNNRIGYGIVDPVAALTAAVPGQNGVPTNADRPATVVLPGAATRDWTPVRVALVGTAAAVALLVLTLFVLHAGRRRRVRDQPPAP
jgi:membrane-anchored mycosin MYCP